MKKIICKCEYDTETATEVSRVASGTFGDPAGYEEVLYRTPEGKMFLYGKGGEASPYAEEKIARLSTAKAEAWIAEHN